MRVLLLSCSTGEGHNSAAHALLQALEDSCVDYELVDGISFMKKGAAPRKRFTPRLPQTFANILFAPEVKELERG